MSGDPFYAVPVPLIDEQYADLFGEPMPLPDDDREAAS